MMSQASLAQEVTIEGHGGFKIAGVLEMPADHVGPVGCVLLMPGSGPTDRDGNQPPAVTTDILKDLSAEIRKAGFATMRFDKRPVARYRPQWPKTMEEIDKFFSFENHIADAVAVYRWMEKRPELNAKKLAVLGHSEGGMITLEMTQTVTPKTLILMGTPGRGMDVVLREQVVASLERSKAPEAIKAKYIDNMDLCIAALKAGKPLPETVEPGLQGLFNPSTKTLFKGYFNYDAPALARKYGGSALVLNGEMDAQIIATKDTPALTKAFESRKTGTSKTVIIPKTSHNFKAVEAPTDFGFNGPVVPAAVTAVVDWVKAELR